jgi:prepilin-type processing-associated H-X9-DG protein
MLIVIVMLFGFSSQSNQERKIKACQNNLQKIYVALEIFAKEHQDAFPLKPDAKTSEEPLSALVPQYTVASDAFVCPGSKDSAIPSAESLLRRRISYAYFMGRRLTDTNEVLVTDKQVNTEAKREGERVFSTTGNAPGNNHHKYGGNYLFVDGHLQASAAHAPFSLIWTQGVVLLNPKR